MTTPSSHLLRQDDLSTAINNPTPQQRIAFRTFPSVFQAWNAADVPNEDKWTTVARHDIVFHAPDFFGLHWDHRHKGLATAFTTSSISAAKVIRENLAKRNPNIVLLAELRYRDAHRSHLPGGHPWWMLENGKPVIGWEEGGYFLLDFRNAAFRANVAKQAAALLQTGVVDGIMLDWWDDDNDRLALLGEIRRAAGNDALILVNANDRKVPRSAKLINGLFMECYKSASPSDWTRITETLRWAEASVRSPRINCLETWYAKSRNDTALMRATTTLALTKSDGYCLFSDPNPLPSPDHQHDWYPFWDKNLGQPIERGRTMRDGSYQRRFSRGLAVHNPPGNRSIQVRLPSKARSAATNVIGTLFSIEPGDGDLLLGL